MSFKKETYPIIGAIIALYALVIILFALTPSDSLLSSIIRLCALLAMTSIFISTIMTPFMVQLYKYFGKPFIKIHHTFSITAIVLATVHPIAFSIQAANLGVFIPVLYPWYDFWLLAGRPALIIIYIALIAVILRKKIPKTWRPLHTLNYIALFFGYIHGILIGTDFRNIGILILFTIMVILAYLALIYKRYQTYQRNQKRKRRLEKQL